MESSSSPRLTRVLCWHLSAVRSEARDEQEMEWQYENVSSINCKIMPIFSECIFSTFSLFAFFLRRLFFAMFRVYNISRAYLPSHIVKRRVSLARGKSCIYLPTSASASSSSCVGTFQFLNLTNTLTVDNVTIASHRGFSDFPVDSNFPVEIFQVEFPRQPLLIQQFLISLLLDRKLVSWKTLIRLGWEFFLFHQKRKNIEFKSWADD